MFSDSYAPLLNGVSISIASLVGELRARGHSVHLYTSRYPGHKDSDPNIVRMRAIHTPWTGDYPVAIPPFYSYVRGFRKHKFDLVHTHTPYTIGYVGMRWAESHGLPLVSTYHTLYEKYAHYIPYFPKWYLIYKIWKHTNYYYNLCDQVIAPSEAAKRSLDRHCVTRPITVIPTGVLPPKRLSRSDARDAIGVRPDERVLLYVGRMAIEKNLSLLLDAVAIVMRERPTTRFILVGDGPDRTRCEAKARDLGIGDKTRFIGAIPRSDVDTYYAAADLFVFASVTETQGLVIGEAMQCGVPAVAVYGGGASAGIKDDENGYVLPPDVTAFANTVLRVIGNAALLERLSRGAIASVQNLTPGRSCDQVLEVYERALTSDSRSFRMDYADSRAD